MATNQKVGSSNLSGRAIFQPLLPLRVILTCQLAHYIRWLAFPQNYFSLMACTALAPESPVTNLMPCSYPGLYCARHGEIRVAAFEEEPTRYK